MRDIRADLEERAKLCDEQIRGAYQQFEIMMHQLQNEHERRVTDLKSTLTMIERLIAFETRHIDNVVPLDLTGASEHQADQPNLSLVDRIRAANAS
jgi:hypothetical protein